MQGVIDLQTRPVVVCSRLKIDILGLVEVRWTEAGKHTINDHVMVYSGHQNEQKNGVGVLLTKQVPKSLMSSCVVW